MRNQLKIILLALCVGGLALSPLLVSSAQRRLINFKATGRGVAPGDYKRTITVGDRVRSYLLHVPPSPNRG